MKANPAITILLLFVAATVLWFILGRPIHQDLGYHQFANRETVLGIPNAANVLSNIPFVIVGLYGLLFTRRQCVVWKTLWIGLILTGIGSAYYHFAPSNATLVWDRFPMAVTFAAVFCIFMQEALQAMSNCLWVWLPYCVLTVVYWAVSDDLRPYAIVQFGGMVFLLVIWLRRWRFLPGWGWVLAGYAAAKILEAGDQSISRFTHGAVSGHPWKHIAAALGFVPLVYRRSISDPMRNREVITRCSITQ